MDALRRVWQLVLANPGVALASATALAYVGAVWWIRFTPGLAEWAAEPDAKQAIWHYYRYAGSGVFPPGHLLTDYAFVYHAQPLWYLPMATLSHVIDPLLAANLLNWLAWLGALAAIFAVASFRTHPIVGLTAVVLLARDPWFFRITAGGYARSFGPLLTLAFLALWLRGHHRLTLLVLVIQAALYPPVAIPCAIAYGTWVLLAPIGTGRGRRIAELTLALAACALLGLTQNLRAPDWWGPIVSLERAEQMPEFRDGGRLELLPFGPVSRRLGQTLTQPLDANGAEPFPALARWNRDHDHVLSATLLAGVVLFAFARRVSLPREIGLLFAGSLIGYLVAREVAFELFVPRRQLHHVWPYLLWSSLALLAWGVARELVGARPGVAAVSAAALALVPVFVLSGNGLGREPAFRSHAQDADLYEFVRTLPVDSELAGSLKVLDEIPLFAQRQVYVNRKMAHPFRTGYHAEVSRRIVDMYRAFFASDVAGLKDLALYEGVDYMVVDARRFESVQSATGSLFEPLRGKVRRIFQRGEKRGFVLAQPPEDWVVFRGENYIIVDLARAVSGG